MMFSLCYEFKHNGPLFRCQYCGFCEEHLEAQNSLHVNRGCCWYFPTYELVDLKNILANGDAQFIHRLLTEPGAIINRFDIKVNGHFDRDGYNQFMAAVGDYSSDFDESLRFRLCPFFGVNGCTISPEQRAHPCNLYLCRELIERAGPTYMAYKQERRDYFAYCAYINESLRQEMEEQGVNLISDPKRTLELIAATDIPTFQPRELPVIELSMPRKSVSA